MNEPAKFHIPWHLGASSPLENQVLHAMEQLLQMNTCLWRNKDGNGIKPETSLIEKLCTDRKSCGICPPHWIVLLENWIFLSINEDLWKKVYGTASKKARKVKGGWGDSVKFLLHLEAKVGGQQQPGQEPQSSHPSASSPLARLQSQSLAKREKKTDSMEVAQSS